MTTNADRGAPGKGAALTYLTAGVVGFTMVGVFLIWLVPLAVRARARDPLTRAHATAAANFGLTVLMALVAGALMSVLLGLGPEPGEDPGPGPLPMIAVASYTLFGMFALLVGAARTALGKDFRLIGAMSLRVLR
ncbi:DUF4870 domain-containing protein [Streptomyces radicis]|uniref:DUF4870 domain-containing protein n=1 Tax=Streptomyces radicis TaxID=1750517 RepID=A0A3A9WK08_9ACTN|nr:DUF4870 domain-containing protein [Streptomyces radicis]RKN06467.1 hypothetical protein D7319_22000 [Streptomyces radicis]RKN20274.1 hypothetical protein D7318_19160 [Streptomyces radicis]